MFFTVFTAVGYVSYGFCRVFYDWNFVKYYGQIKRKEDNRHHSLIETNKPMETLHTRQT